MREQPSPESALLADVLADLMKLYEATGQEDLARKLDKPTRTVQRWFAAAAGRDGKGPEWENAVELLSVSGRLRTSGEAMHEAKLQRVRRVVTRLADDVEALEKLL